MGGAQDTTRVNAHSVSCRKSALSESTPEIHILAVKLFENPTLF